MDQKSTVLLQEKGYSIHNKQRFCGSNKGFFVDCLLSESGSSEVIIHCHLAEREQEVTSALENLRKEKVIMNFSLHGNTVHLLTAGCYAFGNAISLDKTLRSIDECIAVLEHLGFSGNDCPICGKSMMATDTAICPNGMTAHKECATELTIAIDSAPNNYKRGCMGAALGVLIGCIVWVIAFYLGFMTTLAPVLSAFLGSLFWDKFGGKNDMKKILMIVVLTLVGFLITFAILYGLIIMSYMTEIGISGTVFDGLNFIMQYDSEFKQALLEDTVYSLIFCVFGIGFAVFDIYRKQRLTK